MTQSTVSKTLPHELITSTNICHPLLHLAEVTLGGSGPPTATVDSTLATSLVMEVAECMRAVGTR